LVAEGKAVFPSTLLRSHLGPRVIQACVFVCKTKYDPERTNVAGETFSTSLQHAHGQETPARGSAWWSRTIARPGEFQAATHDPRSVRPVRIQVNPNAWSVLCGRGRRGRLIASDQGLLAASRALFDWVGRLRYFRAATTAAAGSSASPQGHCHAGAGARGSAGIGAAFRGIPLGERHCRSRWLEWCPSARQGHRLRQANWKFLLREGSDRRQASLVVVRGAIAAS